MDSNRRAAISAGTLYIAATLTSVVGTQLSRPFLTSANYLTKVSTHTNQVTVGALLEFVAAATCAGIAIAMYPVVKTWSSSLAIGSVVFRAMEGVMYAVAALGLLSVLALSQQTTTAGAAERASTQMVGDSLLDVRDQATFAGVLGFCLGALMYYYVFYRSRLLPRWLSAWGLAAIILLIAAWLLALFNHRSLLDYTVMALPIAVQEMVMAIWLLAKGFNTPGRNTGAPPQNELAATGPTAPATPARL